MWTRITSEKLFLLQSSCLQLFVCKAKAVTCFGETSRASGMFRGADWQQRAAAEHGETTLRAGKAWKQLGMEELSLARRDPGKCCQGAKVREGQEISEGLSTLPTASPHSGALDGTHGSTHRHS